MKREKSSLKKLVIIATYNEAQNINLLIDKIFSQTDNLFCLVVDDNSPDGTADLVEKLQTKYTDHLFLIKRSAKLGYGTAFIEAFKFGLNHPEHFDCFLTMDADFSHNPNYIPDFIKKITDSDIAIGSRYVKGGGTQNWGIHRKILSYGANIYSRVLLNIPVADCTSGFRAYRRDVIEKIDFEHIESNGYSFLEELLYYCFLNKFTIAETPIIFVDRKLGQSKINRKEIFKAIVKVFKLRLRKSDIISKIEVNSGRDKS